VEGGIHANLVPLLPVPPRGITDWSVVKPERSGRDIGFPVSGVPDDVRIETEITGKNGATYFSVDDPQFLTAELEQDGARG